MWCQGAWEHSWTVFRHLLLQQGRIFWQNTCGIRWKAVNFCWKQDLSMTSKDRTRGSASTHSRIHVVLTTLSLIILFTSHSKSHLHSLNCLWINQRAHLTPVFEADVTLNSCHTMCELNYRYSSLQAPTVMKRETWVWTEPVGWDGLWSRQVQLAGFWLQCAPFAAGW